MGIGTKRAVPLAAMWALYAAGCGPPRDDLRSHRASQGGGQLQYDIHFHRILKVGDRLEVVAKVTDTMTQRVSAGGQVLKENTARPWARLDATMRVLAVDNKGAVTRAEYAIHNLEGVVDVLPVCACGWVVTVEQADDTVDAVFTRQRGQLTAEVHRLLWLLIEPQKELGDVYDKCFGTRQRRAVGERWPLSKAKMVRDVAKFGVAMGERDLNGSVALVTAHEARGVPCLCIEANATAAGFTSALPRGAKLVRSKLSTRLVAELPVDRRLPPLRQSYAFTLAAQWDIRSPGGQRTRLDVSLARQVERTYTHLEPER